MRTTRLSQTISPFGVGAILDIEGESLMAADVSLWPEQFTSRIENPDALSLRWACLSCVRRLASRRILQQSRLGSPTDDFPPGCSVRTVAGCVE